MPQRTNYTPPSSSNPYEHDFEDWREELNYYLENDMCDDFWWDEEVRHELF